MIPLSDPPPERFLAFSLGTSQTLSSDVRVRQPAKGTDITLHKVRWGIRAFEPTIYYNLEYGYFSAKQPRLGWTLDLTHNKAIAHVRDSVSVSGLWKGSAVSGTVPMATYVQKLRYTNGINFVSALGVYRGAGPDARFQPFVAGGPSYYILWSRNYVDGIESATDYRKAGLGWLARSGFRYKLSRALNAQATLTYSDGPGPLRTAENGFLSTPLRSWHEAAGLVWRL